MACGRCRQEGHRRNSKKCPLYGSENSSSQQTTSTTATNNTLTNSNTNTNDSFGNPFEDSQDSTTSGLSDRPKRHITKRRVNYSQSTYSSAPSSSNPNSTTSSQVTSRTNSSERNSVVGVQTTSTTSNSSAATPVNNPTLDSLLKATKGSAVKARKTISSQKRNRSIVHSSSDEEEDSDYAPGKENNNPNSKASSRKSSIVRGRNMNSRSKDNSTSSSALEVASPSGFGININYNNPPGGSATPPNFNIMINHTQTLSTASTISGQASNLVNHHPFKLAKQSTRSRPRFSLQNLESAASAGNVVSTVGTRSSRKNSGTKRNRGDVFETIDETASANPTKKSKMESLYPYFKLIPKGLQSSKMKKDKFLHASHNPFWEMVEGFTSLGGKLVSDKAPGNGYPKFGYGNKKYQEHSMKIKLDKRLLIPEGAPDFKKAYQIVLKIHDRNKPFIQHCPYSLDVQVNREKQQIGEEIPVINNAQIPKIVPKIITLTNSSGFRNDNAIPCYVEITWRKYHNYPYTDMGFVIFVGKRCHIEDAAAKIGSESEEETTALIQSKFQSHDDSIDHGLSISELKCKLSCPLTLIKLKDLPVKFKECTHVECFDARCYLQMNYKKGTSWKCPICQKFAPWESLRVCKWIKKVSNETDDETKEIYLTKDGGYKLPSPKKEIKELEDDSRNPKQEVEHGEINDLSDDDENDLNVNGSHPQQTSKPKQPAACIDLCDSTDEEDEGKEIEIEDPGTPNLEDPFAALNSLDSLENEEEEISMLSRPRNAHKINEIRNKIANKRSNTSITLSSSSPENSDSEKLDVGDNAEINRFHHASGGSKNSEPHSHSPGHKSRSRLVHPPVEPDNPFTRIMADTSYPTSAAGLFNMSKTSSEVTSEFDAMFNNFVASRQGPSNLPPPRRPPPPQNDDEVICLDSD